MNKANYTCGMIERTGEFNLSFLSQDIDFEVFKRFGFSGRKDTDKFAGFEEYVDRAANGVLYVNQAVNAMISVKVNRSIDLGTYDVYRRCDSRKGSFRCSVCDLSVLFRSY